MKKNRYLILYFFILLAQVTRSQEAQNDFFYKGANLKREFVQHEDAMFVCDTLNDATICIYNSEDTYWGKEQKLVDNTKLTEAMMLGRVELVIPTSGQWQHLDNIVDKAFSTEMVEQLNGELLLISIDIHSSDGTVAGVGFIFDKGSSYENIPISVYKEIEDEVKGNFVFELTENGKKLNYNMISWLQCPKGRESDGLTVPENGKVTLPTGKLKNPVGSAVGGTIGGSVVTP